MTRYNPQKIYGHESYTIKEIVEILGVSGKTCLCWINQGLKTVPGGKKPILIHGNNLKDFIRQKNSKKKIKLKRNEFYCLGCKKPRCAKRGTLTESWDSKKGICPVCNSKMSRKKKPHQKDYQISSSPIQTSTLFDNLT